MIVRTKKNNFRRKERKVQRVYLNIQIADPTNNTHSTSRDKESSWLPISNRHQETQPPRVNWTPPWAPKKNVPADPEEFLTNNQQLWHRMEKDWHGNQLKFNTTNYYWPHAYQPKLDENGKFWRGVSVACLQATSKVHWNSGMSHWYFQICKFHTFQAVFKSAISEWEKNHEIIETMKRGLEAKHTNLYVFSIDVVPSTNLPRKRGDS